MVCKVGQLINGLLFVFCFSCDDDLSAFFANFLEDLVEPLVEEIGGIGSFGFLFLAVYEEVVKTLKVEFVQFIVSIDDVIEAGIGTGMTGRTVFFDDDL